jgi:hypothetical protein
MNCKQPFDQNQLGEQLEQYSGYILALAKQCEGDDKLLLSILRRLENLHRQIREGLFQNSLPNNRRKLYFLLRDIEEEGGWPYIERMKIYELLANLPEDELFIRQTTGEEPH